LLTEEINLIPYHFSLISALTVFMSNQSFFTCTHIDEVWTKKYWQNGKFCIFTYQY
jgi:hypothetical protein